MTTAIWLAITVFFTALTIAAAINGISAGIFPGGIASITFALFFAAELDAHICKVRHRRNHGG